MARLSAFAPAAQRVALDSFPQLGLVVERALLQVDEPAAAVVEGGVGEAELDADAFGDRFVGVYVAGVGDGRLAEEGVDRRRVGVVAVDPEEGDPPAERGRGALEERELGPAG
jgi:hypothetical protein